MQGISKVPDKIKGFTRWLLLYDCNLWLHTRLILSYFILLSRNRNFLTILKIGYLFRFIVVNFLIA